MQKRSSIQRNRSDSGKRITTSDLTETDAANLKLTRPKNPAAVALGRLGGLKGGKARAAKLSPKQRVNIAKKAAQARWSNTSG